MDREQDIDAAMDTAAALRLLMSRLKQIKFAPEYQKWLAENAKAAERWATKR